MKGTAKNIDKIGKNVMCGRDTVFTCVFNTSLVSQNRQLPTLKERKLAFCTWREVCVCLKGQHKLGKRKFCGLGHLTTC